MNRVRNFMSGLWGYGSLAFCVIFLLVLLGITAIVEYLSKWFSIEDVDTYAHYHGGASRPSPWESFWEALGPRLQAQFYAISSFFARFG